MNDGLPADARGPLFLARLGGLPMHAATRLGSEMLHAALARAAAMEDGVTERAQTASDALYELIGREPPAALRGAMLRVRRDLFNRRAPRPADLAAVLDAADARVGQVVTAAAAALEEHVAAVAAVRAAYERTVADARARVVATLDHPSLCDGLLVSSPSLFRNRDRYRRAAGRRLAARDLQIERGVLRYLTRVAAKATPFASFCTVVAGRFVPSPADAATTGVAYRHAGSLQPRRNVVRLNKSLFATLWDHLRARAAVRASLVVELNPTLQRDETHFTFLAGVQAREVFQRLEASEAVELLVNAVCERAGCRHGELCRLLTADERVEATPDEAVRFVDAMVHVGLLRFRSPVPVQETAWAGPLADALDGVEDEHAELVGALLREAEKIVDAYGGADSAARVTLEARLRDRIAATTAALGLAPSRRDALPLYEDCGAELELQLPASPGVRRALASLRELAQRLLPIAYPRGEMATLRHFFDRHYGDGTDVVPLLAFYEDFYRAHFKEHLARERRLRQGERGGDLADYRPSNPFRLASIERMQQAGAAWTEAIRAAWNRAPDAEELHLAPSDVPTIQDLPPLDPAVPRSGAVFCQLTGTHDGDAARVVTRGGQLFLGFGKYFSRFLELLPPAFTAAVAERNASAAGVTLAEIAADGNFNANLHPQIAPCQIAYPTGDGAISGDTVRCDELEVVRDDVDTAALYLRERATGRRVVPLDLGFLNPRMRPALYQLLLRFAPLGGISVALPTSRLRPGEPPPEQGAPAVVYRPRLVYDDCVVLARRCWMVPATHFPRRDRAEADVDYFLRVNAWRRTLGLPASVYVRVNPQAARPRPPDPALAGGEPAPASLEDLSPDSPGPHDADGVPDDPAAEAPERESDAVDDELVAPAARSARAAVTPNTRNSRDFAKPQFIDFESPLLADLFGRLPASLERFTVTIEECYPAEDASPHIDGEAYATELVLQLDGLDA